MRFEIKVRKSLLQEAVYHVECESVEALRESIDARSFVGPVKPDGPNWELQWSGPVFAPVELVSSVDLVVNVETGEYVDELKTEDIRVKRLYWLLREVDSIMDQIDEGEFSGADAVEALFLFRDEIKRETKAIVR